MKIMEIELKKWQKGWTCEVAITVKTRRQFTAESHIVTALGNRWLTALLAGLLKARMYSRELQQEPGDYPLRAKAKR